MVWPLGAIVAPAVDAEFGRRLLCECSAAPLSDSRLFYDLDGGRTMSKDNEEETTDGAAKRIARDGAGIDGPSRYPMKPCTIQSSQRFGI